LIYLTGSQSTEFVKQKKQKNKNNNNNNNNNIKKEERLPDRC
jgi:hypothetical protein